MKQEPKKQSSAVYAVAGAGVLLICGLSFFAGYQVRGAGLSKNATNNANSQNVQGGFGGQIGGPNGRMGNGTFGEVTAVSEGSITIADSLQNQSKTYTINQNTTITNNQEAGSAADIKVGDRVMVEPSKDDGSIATRIMIGGMGMRSPGGNGSSQNSGT